MKAREIVEEVINHGIFLNDHRLKQRDKETMSISSEKIL